MITSTKAYQTTDGQTFHQLDSAKAHELSLLMPGPMTITCERIVQESDRIIDILTTGPGSRPKARKVNGGRKPRKAKGESTGEDSSSHRGRAGTADQPSD